MAQPRARQSSPCSRSAPRCHKVSSLNEPASLEEGKGSKGREHSWGSADAGSQQLF